MDDIDWTHFPRTKKAVELTEGNRLLREIAEASEGRLVEISPGVWLESKLPPAIAEV